MGSLLYGIFSFAVFAVWGFAAVEVLFTRADRVRNMDKVFWVLLVVAIPFIGAIAWLYGGRPLASKPEAATPSVDLTSAPLGLEDSNLWATTTTPSFPTLRVDDGFETTAAKQRRLAAIEAELDQAEVDRDFFGND